MRLNKFIAQAGIASRRKADELTLAGKVKINGAIMTEPGYDVKDGDVVIVNGHKIESAQTLVYYALNKPVGYVTTTSDEQGRPTVIDLLTDVTTRVYPVGRLDLMTSGLLLLTNDGELANKLTHPSHEIEKTYVAKVNGNLSKEEIFALRKGVRIDGYMTKPAIVTVKREIRGLSEIELTIHEGKNRQVRKMFEAVGYKVLELRRIKEGPVTLGHLHEGDYRKLTPSELEALRKL